LCKQTEVIIICSLRIYGKAADVTIITIEDACKIGAGSNQSSRIRKLCNDAAVSIFGLLTAFVSFFIVVLRAIFPNVFFYGEVKISVREAYFQ